MAEAVSRGYPPPAHERYVAERHRSQRDDFARDRARVLHSAGWRRLAAKTQVLSPASADDFARNRLTHSLEVAQVGRELAGALELSADVVDTACLAHDLGHPPFGHNGEQALDEWAADIGGFEGNAQTLRIVSRLEPKVIDEDGHSAGLNLTRASLDAVAKYPWSAVDAPGITATGAATRPKYGVYDADLPVFRWMRQEAPPGVRCIEADVMDLADDIAYSVHDFEDAVINGYLDPRVLGDARERTALVRGIVAWTGRDDASAVDGALDRLVSLPGWFAGFDGGRPALAALKNLTSDLIGRFARAATDCTRAHYSGVLARYGGRVVVPDEIAAEMAALQGAVGTFVVTTQSRQPLYRAQRDLLGRLADALLDQPDRLDGVHAPDFRSAGSADAQRRVVVDQVASLTDRGAVQWHARLVGEIDPAEVGVALVPVPVRGEAAP